MIAAAILTVVLSGAAGQDQIPISIMGVSDQLPSDIRQASATNLLVSVREPNGLAVTQNAMVKLTCPLVHVDLSGPTKEAALVQFANVPAGDCFVEVNAAGYKPARERTVVMDSLSARNQYVFVYLHPASELAAAGVRPAVSLNVLKEMDKGTEAMRKNHVEDARKHLLKAEQNAPQNPDVQYLLGTLEASLKNTEAASGRFEKAIAYYPTHEHALLALGELQVRNNHGAEAAATLERAVQANTLSYRAQFFLAAAYQQQKAYAKAELHAKRAVELGGERLPMARVLLAQILAGAGDREGARRELEAVQHDYPKDAAATVAKQTMVELDKPTPLTTSEEGVSAVSAVRAGSGDAMLADVGAGPVRPWAPADVDSSGPGVATDVACSEAEIVQRTSQAATEQMENFEKFMASEHIEHEEISRNGTAGHIRTRDFSYLVFIDHAKNGQIFLNESRDGGTGIDEFPTSLATVGLLGLGVAAFHPGFSSALEFKCEGLGQWRGKAAWLMHFRQRAGKRSDLRLWDTRKTTKEIPLKGRVWVAASSYEILHIETDLREPVAELELMRDHLVIDYGPVKFQNGKTELWLPWYADMYLELHGKRYHHRHTLSNYSLFAVDASDKVGTPKGADNPGRPPEDLP